MFFFMIITAPPYQGEAFCFCTVLSAGDCGAAAHGLSIPYHPDIYKTAFCIHLLLNEKKIIFKIEPIEYAINVYDYIDHKNHCLEPFY